MLMVCMCVHDVSLLETIDREKVICYQLSSENNFANILTECSSRHQGESEEVRKQRCYL